MGLVYLWTGEGAGKTTSALGVALRSVGWNHKVVIIQFMKGWKSIGEYKVKSRLGRNYEIRQFGRKGFVNLKNPSQDDKKLAEKGLKFAGKKLKEKPDLLILDEINLAASIGLISKKEVLDLLDKAEKTTIYMTGRHAPKEFIRRADFATEIRQIKHPSDKKIPARKGIEY